MKVDNSICYKDSMDMMNMYSKLIERHNVLCSIEKEFEHNKVAKRYIDKAFEETYINGNHGMDYVMVTAIQNMTDRIREADSKGDVDSMKEKLKELEKENMKLKFKLALISVLIDRKSDSGVTDNE